MCRALNYFKHFFVFISISPFTSSVSILVGITSFAAGLTVCAIAAGIKKYKSIIKKKGKKHDKIVFQSPNI